MINFLNEFLVDANIEKVWNFYTDIGHLKIITPPSIRLEIIKHEGKKIEDGKEVYITGKIFPFFKSKWHSKITFFDDVSYVYVDEMIKGPFKKWKHTHKFVKINENTTKVIDEIEFQIKLPFLDKILHNYGITSLKKIFNNREIETKNILLNKNGIE